MRSTGRCLVGRTKHRRRLCGSCGVAFPSKVMTREEEWRRRLDFPRLTVVVKEIQSVAHEILYIEGLLHPSVALLTCVRVEKLLLNN